MSEKHNFRAEPALDCFPDADWGIHFIDSFIVGKSISIDVIELGAFFFATHCWLVLEESSEEFEHVASVLEGVLLMGVPNIVHLLTWRHHTIATSSQQHKLFVLNDVQVGKLRSDQ